MEVVVEANAATAEESAASAQELGRQASMLEEIVRKLNKMIKGEEDTSLRSKDKVVVGK